MTTVYDCLFVLPNQLFEIPDNVHYKHICLVEHPNYFVQYKYHINKLILHRASMKMYAKKFSDVEYIDCVEFKNSVSKKFGQYQTYAMFDPIDHTIYAEFKRYSKTAGKSLVLLDSPNFMCGCADIVEYAEKYPIISHKTFYTYFRKKFGILVEPGDKPVGGKWSYDKENRLKFPPNYTESREKIKYTREEKLCIEEATVYVEDLLSEEAMS